MRQTGEWAVVIASPVVDRAGQVVAVITVATGLDLADRILEANAPGAGARTRACERPRRERRTLALDATPRGRRPGTPAAVPGSAQRGDLPRRRGHHAPDGGPRCIGASVPVRTAPLQLVASASWRRSPGGGERTGAQPPLIAAAMLVVLLAAALFLARGLAKPVLQLGCAVRELSRNGLSRLVALPLATGGGEFAAALAEDINRMSGRLAETQGRLRSIISLSSDWYWETDEAIRFTSVEGLLEGPARGCEVDTRQALPAVRLLRRSRCARAHAGAAHSVPKRGGLAARPRGAHGPRVPGERRAALRARRRVPRLPRRVPRRHRAARRPARAGGEREPLPRAHRAVLRLVLGAGRAVPLHLPSPALEGGEGVSDFTGFLGKAALDAPAENMTKGDWAAHRAVLERHEPFHDLEILRQDAAGRPHWGAVSGRPMFDESGRFTGYCGVGRNVTARKLAEGALQAERDRLARIIETMDEGLVILDTEGRFLRANGAAERILQGAGPGVDRRGTSATRRGCASARAPRESARALRDMFARLAAGAPRVGPVVHELVLPDGAEKHLSMNGARLQGDDGAFAGVVVTFDDVSERKAHEREIVKLNEDLDRRVQERTAELRVAYRDMESFSYNVSHDLRALLRAMAGFSPMLVEDFADEPPREARRLLERVVKNADRMEQLIEGLLAFRPVVAPATVAAPGLAARDRRRRAGGAAVRDRPAPRRGPRRAVARRLGFSRPRAAAAGVRQPGVERAQVQREVRVAADRDRRAGREVPGAAPTSCATTAPASTWPTQAGCSACSSDCIRRPSSRGNGVGLGMVRRIVERHGGEIWAEAALGEGATLFFRLDGQGIARDPSERPRGRVELKEGTCATARSARVLSVRSVAPRSGRRTRSRRSRCRLRPGRPRSTPGSAWW